MRLLLVLIGLVLALPAGAASLVVDILDVGQGDAILLRTAEKAVLIDAGDRSANTVEQLRALGVARLDLVVATHPHADHIGGLAQVLRSFEVGLFMDNGMPHTTATYGEVMDTLEALKIPYRPAARGLILRMGSVAALEVLHPSSQLLVGTRSDLNSNSVVLLLRHQGIRMLFTGDAEAITETVLVRRGLESAQLLKVAHHGSGHSSTLPFLQAVAPEVAVISCGKDNRYRHPDLGTMARLAHVGALVFRTDLSGNVRVLSDGSTLEVMEGQLMELAALPLVLSVPEVEPPAAESKAPPPVPKSRRELRRLRREQRRQQRQAAKEHRSSA